MHCSNCDQFNAEIAIHSPTQLARVAEAVRAGITSGALRYNSFESDRALIGQASFLGLDFHGPLPDVLRYHFDCPACGMSYGLFVETYHGSGGRWFCTGQLPPNNSFKPSPLRGLGAGSHD